MDGFYIVKEHLIIKNTSLLSDTVYLWAQQLSLLGALMMRGKATVKEIKLIGDGKEHCFGGSRVSHGLQELLEAFEEAGSLELWAEYEYRLDKRDYNLNAGPFVFSTHVELLLKSCLKISENIFYCLHSENEKADSGFTVAYGKKEGKMYFGVTDKNEFEI